MARVVPIFPPASQETHELETAIEEQVMLYVAEQLLIPWLFIALATGFWVGWVSCGPAQTDE